MKAVSESEYVVFLAEKFQRKNTANTSLTWRNTKSQTGVNDREPNLKKAQLSYISHYQQCFGYLVD